MAPFQSLIGARRFREQRFEGRHVVVPFDQGRYRTEASQRVFVQGPHVVADGAAVIIDQQLARSNPASGVAGEMNFLDGVPWQRREERIEVETEVRLHSRTHC